MARLYRVFLLGVLGLFLCGFNAFAQLVSGTITGTVVDQGDASVPGATVTLVNEGTREVRTVSSNVLGLFNMPAVPPGTYTIRIEMKGFRTSERNGQVVAVGDHVSLGKITLQIGDLTEKIVVQAEGAMVRTSSSETSHSITSNQIDRIQTKARDAISLLRLLPGVALTGGWADTDSLGGAFGTGTPNFSGTRKAWNSISIDGQTESNAFDQSVFNGMSSLDSLSEARIVVNNYQAEYGRNSGAFINFVSKSGTKDFHGNAYWFKRHEQFNANDFFRNRNSQIRPLYRYANFGGTIGGPVFIPGAFNTSKDKLFFFFSAEGWRTFSPITPGGVTVPTDLERAGNFSRTLDLNGAVVQIKDPLNGQQFPDNTIPLARINKEGQRLLTIFPQPNFFNRAISGGNYNFLFPSTREQPKHTELLKLDYNLSSKDRISGRFRNFWQDQRGWGIGIGSTSWPLMQHHYAFPTAALNLTYTRTISPTLLNEFSLGRHWGAEDGTLASVDLAKPVQRTTLGITIKQFHPEINPLNVLPQVSFGGVPNAAGVSWDDRFPLNQTDRQWEFRDTFSYSRGAHLFKFGGLYEYNWTNKGVKGNFGGIFRFDRDVNNPNDSNYGYSNALLGNFASYQEATARGDAPVEHTIWEFFGQDTWKINRRLTLDYGVRASWGSPYQYTNANAGGFILERYDAKKSPPLIQPAFDANGKRAGVNPVTGAVVPAVMIGSYVPGAGDPANGVISSGDTTYPRGFRNAAPLQFAPRLGFAYDVSGNGKTAIRGGFAITKQMTLSAHEMVWNNLTHPPVQFNPTIFYGNLDTFLQAGSVLFPSSVQGLEKNPTTPSVYSYSLTVERELGRGTVLSAGYVGNVGRHLEQSRNLNVVPYGAHFLPQNIDPTTRTPLPDRFYRPYPGYENITYVENSGTSNYNGLQVSANRRFAKGLQGGIAYTWSKAMGVTDSDGGLIPTYLNARTWLYGKLGFDQTHVFIVNYTYDIPKASHLWNNIVTRAALDNWQLSGVTTFASGFPSGIGFSTVDGADITGGGDFSRINVTGKAQLPFSERQFLRFFDPTVFARPPKGSAGNAPKDVFRGPGIANWDISVFKNFPLFRESRYLQFRAEAYNALNHTQFAGVNTTARFDAAGNQVNTQFGQVTSTRQPRIMQLSLSIRF